MDKQKLKQEMINQAAEQALASGKAPEHDLSLMIKLTPAEIKNMMKLGQRCNPNKTYTFDELVDFHYDVAIGILEKTDPDRFMRQ